MKPAKSSDSVSDKSRVKPRKARLDEILVARGIASTRTKAQALIMAGEISVQGFEKPKPGMKIPESAPIVVAEKSRWVGRGGGKLAGAFEDFAIERISGVWLDCGAGTGGFTDVLLQSGATRVYAADVGHGQFDQKLRDDPRVVVIEKFNMRNADRARFPEPFDGAVIDLSFISLRLVLPAIGPLLKPSAPVFALFKPQFEADVKEVSRGKGVIRSEETRARLLEEFESWCAADPKSGAAPGFGSGFNPPWKILGRHASRVTGREGNQEYFYQLAFSPIERNDRQE